jgi:hypothetical protein
VIHGPRARGIPIAEKVDEVAEADDGVGIEALVGATRSGSTGSPSASSSSR